MRLIPVIYAFLFKTYTCMKTKGIILYYVLR